MLGRQADWPTRIVEFPRVVKRAILIGNDLFLLALALWLGFSLRLSELYVPSSWEFAVLLAAAPIIGVATFSYLGLYRLVTRFIGAKGTTRIVLAVVLAVTFWSLLVLLSGTREVIPRSSIIIYLALSVVFVWSSRQIAGWILSDMVPNLPMSYDPDQANALIYGAGQSGVQLSVALRQSGDYNLIGFIDEDRSFWGQNVSGLKVYRPKKLAKLIRRNGVQEILLAIPGASKKRRRTIIRRLEKFPVVVKILPEMADIATGRVSVTDLRHVEADDLLGRDPVPPNVALMRRDIAEHTVLITGAGGSIGSELTRQIIKLDPARIVLMDVSEVALYEIEREVRAAALDGLEIIAVLGSVCDPALVRLVIKSHGVDTIYHAAAYKHVPIVELNPVAGLANNTFGTLTVAEAARDMGVRRFVLVSTDKAVRPTNIMGASKRLAELVLQAYAELEQRQGAALAAQGGERSGTVFTMVRFGNVLDSSGSVVRLFRDQIARGGPVTVTHPDMTRYFMSIPEAATLVIQAGAMASGGDVFVLDMGKPVRIDQLARSMIRLMGLEVLGDNNPEGDIAIEYTGLRPGEKLYEELLIGENTTGTDHPRIARNHEPFLSLAELKTVLSALQAAMEQNDIDAVQSVLKETVEGYVPERRHLPTGATTEEPTSAETPGVPATQEADIAKWRRPAETLH